MGDEIRRKLHHKESKKLDQMIKGKVIFGQGKYKNWRLLPTANILQSTPRLQIGVYTGECFSEGGILGICMISVYATSPEVIEVYICDFDGDLYGKEIELKSIREIKYEDFKTLTDKALIELHDRYEPKQ